MIRDEDYHTVFMHMLGTNLAMQTWYGQYTRAPGFYELEGNLVMGMVLTKLLIEGDLSKLEIPNGMPREIHNKAVKALRSVDIEPLVLQIRLGV